MKNSLVITSISIITMILVISTVSAVPTIDYNQRKQTTDERKQSIQYVIDTLQRLQDALKDRLNENNTVLWWLVQIVLMIGLILSALPALTFVLPMLFVAILFKIITQRGNKNV